jgi:hypothetical protein
LWQELDHYQNLQPKCSADAVKIKKMIEEEHIYEFLGGLNSKYDPVRVQIFGKEPLPSLQKVFSHIQNEESRRSTMLHPSSQIPFALVSASPHPSRGDFKSRDGGRIADATSDDKEKLFCDYCNRSRHSRETCWQLNGRPTNRGCGGHTSGATKPWANHTSTVEMDVPTLDPSPSSTDMGGLSKEEVEALRRLMSRLDTSTTASSSFAHTGNLATALHAFATPSEDPWVIDSGASDHMIGTSPLFSSYNPCSGRDKVRIADDSLSPVSGKGSISVTPSITLSSVLHVPDLAANLLSIACITLKLNYRVIFLLLLLLFSGPSHGEDDW